MWRYQLEKILALYYDKRICEISDMIDSLQEWMQKKEYNPKIGRLMSIEITDVDYLLDFISERMILGYSKWPNLNGAAVLYEYLKKINYIKAQRG